MTNDEIIQKTSEFVKEEIKHADGAHDWWHIVRVHNNAKEIALNEKADNLVVELTALLHDVTDLKVSGQDEAEQEKKLSNFLDELSLTSLQKKNIIESIAKQSFRKSLDGVQELSIEGKIVQDADRLEALGAIGIARVFAYGGAKGREIYNPNEKPSIYKSSAEYKAKTAGTSINHFYEKLLLLKEMMNTNTAKKLAQERHEFMELFLDRFYKDWNGKSYSE